jgi:hypothetical protein
VKSESRKSAIRRVMSLKNLSRDKATALVDQALRQIQARIRRSLAKNG